MRSGMLWRRHCGPDGHGPHRAQNDEPSQRSGGTSARHQSGRSGPPHSVFERLFWNRDCRLQRRGIVDLTTLTS
jgi:hypothetical protein